MTQYTLRMQRLPLILSCLSLLISAFALHVAFRTQQDIQAFVHSLPKDVLTARPVPGAR